MINWEIFMKTTGKIVSVMAIFLLAAFSAFGESGEKEKGVIGKIVDDLVESTRTINEINKENMEAVRAETKANFDEATAPSAALIKFREAKGFRNKIKAMAEGVIESTRESAAKEKARRAEIQSHSAYRKILEDQRGNKQEVSE